MNRVQAILWHPLGWLGFQLAELLVLAAAIDVLTADGHEWTSGLALWLVGLILLFLVNLWIRRRFLPEDPHPSELSAGTTGIATLLIVVVVYLWIAR